MHCRSREVERAEGGRTQERVVPEQHRELSALEGRGPNEAAPQGLTRG